MLVQGPDPSGRPYLRGRCRL